MLHVCKLLFVFPRVLVKVTLRNGFTLQSSIMTVLRIISPCQGYNLKDCYVCAQGTAPSTALKSVLLVNIILCMSTCMHVIMYIKYMQA